MKILHLINTDGISGAEKHLEFLLPGMDLYGHDCHLLIIHPQVSLNKLSVFCKTLNTKGVKTTLINSNWPFSFSVIKKVRNYLKLNDINIVHSHLSRADILAVILKVLFVKKLYIISTKHGYQESILTHYNPACFVRPKNFYYYVTKYCISKINTNISISDCISKLYLNFNITKTYFKVIHHGVDVKFDNEVVDCFKINGPKLVIVARLEPYKGHKYVIDAFKMVLAKIPNAQLFLLGEGSYKTELKKMVEKNDICENVKFLGFQKNALAYMKQSDLVIVPSLFEPFGLVFIEAIGLEKCVVAFDVPAGNEILNNHVAQLVPKEDVPALGQKIIEMLLNTTKRAEIEKNAYQYYLKNYTTKIMRKNTAEFYNSLA